MNLLVGALTVGLILALMTVGVFIAYRVLDSLDLTADGAFGLGAAVAGVLLVHRVDAFLATAAGTIAGALAGTTTGLLHTRLRVSLLLAGILTTTALYSITLYIMGGGDLSLAPTHTLVKVAEEMGQDLMAGAGTLTLFGTPITARNWLGFLFTFLLVASVVEVINAFFRTNLGLAMRATGDNPRMARALGVNVPATQVFGLTLANGLIALSGAVFAQYLGFVNIQLGAGILVAGLASLMIGETVLGKRGVGRRIGGAVVGAVIYRLLVAGALRAGLDPNALKLVTALLVLAALVVPALWRQRVTRQRATEALSRG
jgi:putative ABC transport system permease protein